MKKKYKKNKRKNSIGIQPIVGATRYTITENGKTKTFDVFKRK